MRKPRKTTAATRATQAVRLNRVLASGVELTLSMSMVNWELIDPSVAAGRHPQSRPRG